MSVDFVIRYLGYFGYSITLSSEVFNPGGRAVEGLGLRPLACRDCGFKFRQGQGCFSLMCVVCCTYSKRLLLRADPSSRGVLPSVYMSLSVIRCNN